MALTIQAKLSAKVRFLALGLVMFGLAAQPAYGLIANQVAHAVAGTVVVRQGSPQGWKQVGSGGSFSDAQAKIGSGSYKLTAGTAGQKAIANNSFAGTKLSDITELKYSSYVETRAGDAVAPLVRIDTKIGSTNTTLVWEPAYGPGSNVGSWQDFDPLTQGKWWSTTATGIFPAPTQAIASMRSWTEIITAYPTITVRSSTNGGVYLSAGQNSAGAPWTNFTGYVDNFTFNGTTYDFESAANPVVNGENFNTHSGGDYKGINVGFNINNDFGTISAVSVALYQDDTLLATNTGNAALLALANGGTTQLSTPFITEAGTYTEEYWDLGSHAMSPASKPNKAVVTVAGTNGVRSATLASLAEPNDWLYESLFPVGVPVHESPSDNAVINYNDFYFDWSDVEGAVSYEMQNSTNPAVATDGSFQNVMWIGDYQKNQPTESRARSVGASGTWYWQVRAVDAHGNKSAWTSPWKLTIDMNAPAAPVLSAIGLNSGDITNQSSITATWNKPSDDTVKYEYQYWNTIPGNLWTASNPWATDVFSESRSGDFTEGEGTHYLRVRAVDLAGNASEWSNVFAVTYDKTSPDVKVNLNRLSYVESSARVSSASNPEIEATDAYLDKIELWKDGVKTGSTWSATGASRRAKIGFLGEGTYTIRVYDKAGNTADFIVTIDNSAPSAVFSFSNNNGNALTKDDVTVTMTADESIQTPTGWTRLSDTEFTRIYTSNGKTELTITDLAGNTSALQKFEVKRIDRNPPTITGISNGAIVNGPVALVIFDPKYEGYDGFDRLQGLTVNGVAVPTIEGSDKTYLYAVSAEGYYTVIATDKAGNSTTVTFTIDTTAPTLTLDLPMATTTTTPALTGTIDDPNATVFATINGVEAVATNNGDGTWVYIIPAPLSVGDHSIVVVARDAAGNSSTPATGTLTILTPVVPPVVTNPVVSPSAPSTANPQSDDPGEDVSVQPLVANIPGFAATVPGFIVPVPNQDASESNGANSGSVLGEQDNEADSATQLEDTDVLGATDNRLLGLMWYWWVVIVVALVGGWLLLAAAIRRGREEEM